MCGFLTPALVVTSEISARSTLVFLCFAGGFLGGYILGVLGPQLKGWGSGDVCCNL